MTAILFVLAAIRWIGILGAAVFTLVAAIAWDPGWLVAAVCYGGSYFLATWAFVGLADIESRMDR